MLHEPLEECINLKEILSLRPHKLVRHLQQKGKSDYYKKLHSAQKDGLKSVGFVNMLNTSFCLF